MGNIIDITDADFDREVMQSEVPVLVDFWSPTCVPCRAMAPVVAALAEEFGNEAKFVKVNIFESNAVAAKLGVSTLPTLILFSGGQMVERLMGVHAKDKLIELIDQYV
ncbi:MAG: thioredoxin [Thermoguttaceae bacterium]|nr:thioredoxin [Thermoguttaceae bacterium]